MKCANCGGKQSKKIGSVYGQPNQSTEYLECGDCGLHSNSKIKGIQVFDEVDLAEKEKNAS